MQGMLYYLTKSEALLPAKLDGAVAQKSDVWSDGKKFTENEWKAKLAAMHQQYPVIIFSKVSFPYSNDPLRYLVLYSLCRMTSNLYWHMFSLDLLSVSKSFYNMYYGHPF
jgi:hypothetical protein